MMAQYTVKDSGERMHFHSGMQRDTSMGKVNYSLVLDGPLVKRLAEHLTKGAAKYDDRNWMKATGDAEYQRFRESAFRHFVQWWDGEDDEDHFAATIFNMNGAEHVGRAQSIDATIESPILGRISILHDCGICDLESDACDCLDRDDNSTVTGTDRGYHAFSEKVGDNLPKMTKGQQMPKIIGK